MSSGSIDANARICAPKVSPSCAPRTPSRNACSWRRMYQASWPASRGALRAGFPSPAGPWQAVHTAYWPAPAAGSAFASACVWLNVGIAASQASNSSRGVTTTRPRIAKCATPQSSSQRISYEPGTVGVSQRCVIIPGTRSILTRNCVTVKLCSTSFERSSTLTGWSTGRRSSGLATSTSSLPAGSSGSTPKGLSAVTSAASLWPSAPSLPGKRNDQCHCWPTASTIAASSGTSTNLPQTKSPGASIAATPIDVTIVSHHSSFLFSGS